MQAYNSDNYMISPLLLSSLNGNLGAIPLSVSYQSVRQSAYAGVQILKRLPSFLIEEATRLTLPY